MAGIKGIQHFESFLKLIVKTLVKKLIIKKCFVSKTIKMNEI